MKTAVIIPALNEGESIGDLVTDALGQAVGAVIVVDNGSTDDTGSIAWQAGAHVVREPRRGYGYACAAGAAAAGDAGVLVFLDGDYSFLPSEMGALLGPIREERADLVLGSRPLGGIPRGAMPPHQRIGNWMVSQLIRTLYGVPFTDLGPYRAIRTDLLTSLGMREMTFGWPTEMVIKAVRRRARIVEVPVRYQLRRAGQSKVSGTLRGSVLAAYEMLNVTFRSMRWS